MKKISDLVREHEALRRDGINLIASENVMAPEALRILCSDLAARYHSDWYAGSSIVREIAARTEELARELFKARHALVSPISGNVCDLAAVFALTNPGDAIAMLPFSSGGYPLGLEIISRRRVDIEAIEGTFVPDANAPLPQDSALVVAGASFIPFPHPVSALAQSGSPLVYDGSHVLGLIACGVFQDPLREGALALFGSTHKSFPGPQGGLVLCDSDEIASKFRNVLDFDLAKGIGLVDNPHPARIAALGATLEFLLENRDYGPRVVENAVSLAHGLTAAGVPVKFADMGFTKSHQVFLDLKPEKARAYCLELEKSGIFIDVGGRMGVQEATSRGMGPGQMKEIAGKMGAVFSRTIG